MSMRVTTNLRLTAEAGREHHNRIDPAAAEGVLAADYTPDIQGIAANNPDNRHVVGTDRVAEPDNFARVASGLDSRRTDPPHLEAFGAAAVLGPEALDMAAALVLGVWRAQVEPTAPSVALNCSCCLMWLVVGRQLVVGLELQNLLSLLEPQPSERLVSHFVVGEDPVVAGSR